MEVMYMKALKTMWKKALILVPHQDDEIAVAGVLIKWLVELQVEVYVCYATNGDYEVKAEIRLEEAANALNVLGVPRNRIITLGYPDTSNESEYEHLFYYNGKDVLHAKSGHAETYSAGDFVDYAFLTQKEHHPYHRLNFEFDVKHLMLNLMPDLCVCVDMDHHIDHRMLSLTFDKMMGKILKECPGYQPTVWKAFAYGTNYSAIADYRTMNLESTKFPNTRLRNNKYRLDNPFYDWEKRIRLPNKNAWYRGPIENTPFYRALECHVSQKAIVFAERAINSDQVFWERRSDNIMLHGKIEASSGYALRLNDFMLFDAETIHVVEELKLSGLWIPHKSDKEKKLILQLDKPYKLDYIAIWGIGKELEIKVEYAGKVILKKVDLLYGEWQLPFEDPIEIDNVQLSFKYDEKHEFGIGEIEVFEKKDVITKYLKLLVDGNMHDTYYTWMHKPKISVYRYCQYDLREKGELTYMINGKVLSNFSRIPWTVFLFNRIIKIKVYEKNATEICDEIELIRMRFAEWLRARKG